MIDPVAFCHSLKSQGIDFIAGVPDSLLAEFCACANEIFPSEAHVISANEGNAIGMAIGHFLGTGKPGLVYMQNSGIGNAVNPLVSLASSKVYSIPMVLMIGWRGEIDEAGDQLKDEPQHVLQGKITLAMLENLGIKTIIMDKESNADAVLNSAVQQTTRDENPVALLIRKNTFAPFDGKKRQQKTLALSRFDALDRVVSALDSGIPVFSTTGKLSRELYELRKSSGNSLQRDFLTVGGMGHASSIAAGFSVSYKGRVACLDGDGALLMHMGALTETAKHPNLLHIVFNNGAHESVGGQPTAALEIPLTGIASQAGYKNVFECRDESSLVQVLAKLKEFQGSTFIEIFCSNSSDPGLGRPEKSPLNNREEFMSFVRGGIEKI